MMFSHAESKVGCIGLILFLGAALVSDKERARKALPTEPLS